MFIRKILLCAILCLSLSLVTFAADGQTMYNAEYCFSEADFSNADGIFITAVPDVAVLRLGNRTICVGDVLSAQSLNQLKLIPCGTQNCTAVVSYQPISGGILQAPATLTIRIQNGKNETPKVENVKLETYKNIANDGKLCATDPENAPLTYQIVDAPKYGDVKIEADGTFIYTPHKNKVGDDRFTYTATDEAGNVSDTATVSIRILSPTEKMTFSDMSGEMSHFEAMWLREKGLYGGKRVGNCACFCPDETVSRCEFLVMAMELMNVNVKSDAKASFADLTDAPQWMRPFIATAAEMGIVRGRTSECFCPNDAISAQEAAVILQNILQLPMPASTHHSAYPAWSAKSVLALSDAGICADYHATALTYTQTAELLYQIANL